MNKILFASRNPGKLIEIKSILGGLPVLIESLLEYPHFPDIVENGNTLEENAFKKAREIFLATSIPTIADDTGLEVYHLKMAPGVFSARYAGEKVSYAANNKKLLDELKGAKGEKRNAQFRCVATFIANDFEISTVGICKGRILEKSRGAGGFGYDPIFLPDGFDKTFAEMSPDLKNKISHRANAFRQLINVLTDYFNLVSE
ncbi:MAG: RdgB/HAM1 family non-canonical purine NTP pyrophosphatase [Bacteroidota bacterium]|nr:RdgB/HAM1 family non-canonical purine NTP pyrophosphatase [Bacteroidota bacterium]